MRIRTWMTWVALGVAVLAGPWQAAAKSVKVVKVDCSKGDRITEALGKSADELVVEISGMCREHVVITRSDVTLRGGDPALDGIEGPIGDPKASALVEIYDADDVRIENLRVTGSEGIGLGVWEAGSKRLGYTMLVNCRLEGNDTGAHFSAHSFGPAKDTAFSGNRVGLVVGRHAAVPCEGCTLSDNSAQAGVVTRAGSLWCSGCTAQDNGGWAFTVGEDGYLALEDSEVSGNRGVIGYMEAFVLGLRTHVTAAGHALNISEQSDLNWFGGSFSGTLQGDWKSLLYLEGTTQLAPGIAQNRIADDSTLFLIDSTLAGQTVLESFANGTVYGASDLGDLTCDEGADLVCHGSVARVSPTGCGHCP